MRQAGQLIRRWAATTTNAAAAASSSGPRPHVYLAADMLGQEPLLALVGAEFGQPVYVPPPERHREVRDQRGVRRGWRPQGRGESRESGRREGIMACQCHAAGR